MDSFRNKLTIRSILICILSFLSILLFAFSAAPLEVGQTIERMDIDSIEGIPVSLYPPAGKLQAIGFFDTRQDESVQAIQDFYLLYRRFHDRGLDALGVYANPNDESVLTFSEQWQIPWPQVMNQTSQGQLTEKCRIDKIPSYILIDDQGAVLAQNLERDEIHQQVASLLNVSLTGLPMPETPTQVPARNLDVESIYYAPVDLSESLTGVNPYFGTAQRRKLAEPCKSNLRKISLAITRFRCAHDGEFPKWLSDLYPDYIDDKSVFLCPDNPINFSFGNNSDPKLTCSYLYELAPVEHAPGQVYRDWKPQQMRQYGDKVPIVRCWNHSESLNLTYGGEILFYPTFWEGVVPTGHTLEDPDAKVRQTLLKIAAALDQYKKDKGDVPNDLNELLSYSEFISDPAMLELDGGGYPPYQFTTQYNYREQKNTQLKEFGGYVPIVRVRNALPNGRVVNLGYHGEIWESSSVWESDIQSDAPSVDRGEQTVNYTESNSDGVGLDYQLDKFRVREDGLSHIAAQISRIIGYPIDVRSGGDEIFTLELENKTVRQILDILLPPIQLGYTQTEDGTIVIDTKENISSLSTGPVSTTPNRSQLARVEAELRTLSMALESFFIDNNRYPTQPDNRDTIAEAAIKLGEGSRARYIRLTTPVAYISRLPRDPFNPEKPSYRYISNGTWYALISNGPDGDSDIDISSLQSMMNDLSTIRLELDKLKYDPATGEGDLFRIGPR